MKRTRIIKQKYVPDSDFPLELIGSRSVNTANKKLLYSPWFVWLTKGLIKHFNIEEYRTKSDSPVVFTWDFYSPFPLVTLKPYFNNIIDIGPGGNHISGQCISSGHVWPLCAVFYKSMSPALNAGPSPVGLLVSAIVTKCN